ncbi:MAG: ATP-binding protein [Desulfomonilia bacterium]|nr:ATP-binding protein [Desulfomonilia bacterium]
MQHVYRDIVERSPFLICRFLPGDGTITLVNEALCLCSGTPREELLGTDFFCLVPREDHTLLRDHLVALTRENPQATIEHALLCPGGTRQYRWITEALFHHNGGIYEYQSIGQDITETKNQETHAHHAQKMEAIGTLAGGIAHDFNNILSGILGFTELAIMETEQGSSINKKLEHVIKSGNRAKELIKQILLFSRQGDDEKKPIHIQAVIEDALKMLRASLPSSQEIFQVLDAGDAIVEADPTQIHQIVINLCTNAYDAVRDTGGFIEVKLFHRKKSDRTGSEATGEKPGSCVELIVTDTGSGMAPQVMARIFDPYYTTKEKGKGTGLGLAIVHGIIKSLGGTITVQSIQGKGTTFSVLLPGVDPPGDDRTDENTPIPTGNERILFVDDEEDLTDMVRQMLELLGYHVTTRTGSIEALELFRTHADSFDLVITDLIMPKLTGEDLARNILSIREDIPIILCTGFSDAITEETTLALGIRRLIMKPLILREFAQVIRSVLDTD